MSKYVEIYLYNERKASYYTIACEISGNKNRVNIWMSPEGKEKLSEFAKTTPEKSMQKYLLRLIKEDYGIDCDPKEK